MSTKISKEQLQKILVQEAKHLQSQGYTKEQIKEIFDNRFVKSVGDRARSLFKGSRDKSPMQSKELPADFDRKKITPQDLIDLIFNDPNVPQYIKNIAATLEYNSEEASDSEQSKYDEVALFDDEEDIGDGEVEDPAMLDMDVENAVEKTKPAPKNPETKNTDSKPAANKAQSSSPNPRSNNPAKKAPAKSQSKPKESKSKPKSTPKAQANEATPFKNVAKKKSLKESILDRLPEKDRNDPKVKQLVEAIEKQYNKKKV